MKFMSWMLVLGLIPLSAAGQVDGPPQEPPYVTIEEELPSEPAVVPAEVQPAQREPTRRVIRRTPQGRQFIEHPLAEQGLMLIDKDGSYVYRTERQTVRSSYAAIRLGLIDPGPRIDSADGQANYSSIYGSGSPFTAMFDYEWKPFKLFGELGIQAGLGMFTSQGQGRFADGSGEARERYTFYALPISLGAVYRFQYVDNQWIAPYVAGGLMYFALAELRDDNKAPNFVGTPTGYAAGGLMFNLSAIDRQSAFIMDAEYGIHTLWLSLEARQIQATNLDLDVGGTFVNLAIGVDY